MSKPLIIQLRGGLGNQLFHYAFAKVLESRFKREILLDASDYVYKKGNGARNLELESFNISLPIIKSKWQLMRYLRSSIVNKYFICAYNNLIYSKKLFKYLYFNPKSKILFAPDKHFGSIDSMILDNIYYICKERFWNHSNFIAIQNDILKDLELEIILDSKNLYFLQKINTTQNSTAIHIRRGDFLKVKYPVNLSESNYYKNAINFMRKKHQNIHFFIFSDDKNYIKQYFSFKDCTLVDCNDDSNVIFDFYLMCKCNHFIMANSTLSWWVAFSKISKNSTIVTPNKWLIAHDKVDFDFAPKHWIRIEYE